MLQILLGASIFCICVVMHSWATLIVVMVLRRRKAMNKTGKLAPLLIGVSGLLATAHLVEVLIWGLAIYIVGAVPREDAYYFAFVSYTTLGYGDVLASVGWRFLGPTAAMSGVLMFGWSTAILVDAVGAVLREHGVMPPDNR